MWGTYYVELNYRRNFRSQTSDNMDRWKSRGGKSQRREEQKRGDQRRERVKRKKMQVREKVGKLWNTVFFQWFVAPEGRKVGSLKRRVRSHVVRWEMKSCTPLWPEAHFEVKMYKTPCSDHFLEVAMSKKCTLLWRKAHVEVKMYKTMLGPLLEVDMSKKCTLLWRKAHFQVKMLKKLHARTAFEGSDVGLRGRRKWAKREGFVAFPKTMAGVGHLKKICKHAFSVAGAVQETCSFVHQSC